MLGAVHMPGVAHFLPGLACGLASTRSSWQAEHACSGCAAQPVAEHYSLDGVLTLVDAKHVMRHLDEQKPEGVVNEALAQVAYADRIILNKTDLVGPPSTFPSLL